MHIENLKAQTYVCFAFYKHAGYHRSNSKFK